MAQPVAYYRRQISSFLNLCIFLADQSSPGWPSFASDHPEIPVTTHTYSVAQVLIAFLPIFTQAPTVAHPPDERPLFSGALRSKSRVSWARFPPAENTLSLLDMTTRRQVLAKPPIVSDNLASHHWSSPRRGPILGQSATDGRTRPASLIGGTGVGHHHILLVVLHVLVINHTYWLHHWHLRIKRSFWAKGGPGFTVLASRVDVLRG